MRKEIPFETELAMVSEVLADHFAAQIYLGTTTRVELLDRLQLAAEKVSAYAPSSRETVDARVRAVISKLSCE